MRGALLRDRAEVDVIVCYQKKTRFIITQYARVVTGRRHAPRLLSSRILHATQTCWSKHVGFEKWNINFRLTFLSKNYI